MRVYFNHDGGIDDFVSLLLLLKMKNVELIGVGAIGADSYVTPAVSGSQKIISRFSNDDQLEVSASDSRAANPFPKEWRMNSFMFDALPVLNQYDLRKNFDAEKPAHLDLVAKINQSDQTTTLLFTGPLTDLARALEADSSIAAKIERLYWMGGGFSGGNVHEPEHDGSAEWNAFWDPQAVKTVFDTKIPITMVGLESSQQLPITPKLRKRWAKLRDNLAMDLIGQGYAMVDSQQAYVQANESYYMWDVLTTIILEYPELTTNREVSGDVIVNGLSQGQTIETKNGRPITLVESVEAEAFFDAFENILMS